MLRSTDGSLDKKYPDLH